MRCGKGNDSALVSYVMATYKRTAECTLCKKAHEESGSSWNRELPEETIGHIQKCGMPWTKGGGHCSTQCVHPGAATEEVDVHGKADRHMKLLTIETESRLGTLRDQEQCT